MWSCGRGLTPQALRASEAQFAQYLKDHLPSQNEVPPERVGKLYEQYGVDKWNLADRGYLASVHPLELWMVAYLREHPGATLSQMMAASGEPVSVSSAV